MGGDLPSLSGPGSPPPGRPRNAERKRGYPAGPPSGRPPAGKSYHPEAKRAPRPQGPEITRGERGGKAKKNSPQGSQRTQGEGKEESTAGDAEDAGGRQGRIHRWGGIGRFTADRDTEIATHRRYLAETRDDLRDGDDVGSAGVLAGIRPETVTETEAGTGKETRNRVGS